LSEAVFKWKGFILEGVNFYRNFLVNPLALYAKKYFDISLNADFIDTVAVFGSFWIATLRAYLFRTKEIFKRVAFGFFCGFSFFILISGSYEPNYAGSPHSNGAILFFYLPYSLMLYHMTSGAARLIAVFWFAFPPFLILILGAIAAGVSRG
jgi:hypothetical protein